MNYRLTGIAVVGSLMLTLSACSSMPKVERIDVAEQKDLSGEWNDTDSQMVSAEMISDCLARPWLIDFVSAQKNKPRVIVGTIVNKSHEHINTDTFINDLQREITNSGKVVFVASKDERSEVRDERKDQAENATMETAKSAGNEYGADFMLKGEINTILDEAGKMQVKYYQVNLELINMLTNEKAWIGQKQIKKLVKRSKTRL